MQQNQQPNRRFSQTAPQQPVYRFPQNQNMQGWQPQQNYTNDASATNAASLSRQDKRELSKLHRRKRRKIFTLWNLFAVIGIATTTVQLARYVIIPALVYLKVLAGGVQ